MLRRLINLYMMARFFIFERSSRLQLYRESVHLIENRSHEPINLGPIHIDLPFPRSRTFPTDEPEYAEREHNARLVERIRGRIVSFASAITIIPQRLLGQARL